MSNAAAAEQAERQLTVAKPALPAFNLTPQTLAEAMELAKLMAESDLVPKDFHGKPGNVLVAVQMGSEIGLGPMASVQNIAVINGKPGVYGDAGKALLLAAGCLIEEADIEEIRKTGIARCRITRPNGVPTERTFSVEDAKTAQLWGKQGPWSTMPYRQMAWRAFWFAARDGAADILKGLGGGEELRDIEPRNITPEAERPSSTVPPRKSERLTLQPATTTEGTKVEETAAQDKPAETNGSPEASAQKPTAGGDPDFKLVTKLLKLMPDYNRKHGNGAATALMEKTYEVDQASKLRPDEAAEFLAILEKDLGRSAS